jgi:hypothetical protein
MMYPTFKGCLQRIDISGQVLGSEQISPKNYQETDIEQLLREKKLFILH